MCEESVLSTYQILRAINWFLKEDFRHFALRMTSMVGFIVYQEPSEKRKC